MDLVPIKIYPIIKMIHLQVVLSIYRIILDVRLIHIIYLITAGDGRQGWQWGGRGLPKHRVETTMFSWNSGVRTIEIKAVK